MKYLKKKFLRPTGLLSLLLSLLGLGGCDPFVEPEMYGTPTVYYSVRGTVTDEKGDPIEGIQVTVGTPWTDDGTTYYSYPIGEAVTTDDKGYWTRAANFFPADTLLIHFKDIDGEEHGGEFADDSTAVPVTIHRKDTGNMWFIGVSTVDVSDIKLKKK